MNSVVKQIPNFITILNLVSGVIALFFAIDGHLTSAGIFICISAVFDFLDGMAARLLDAHSDIGKNLDSLADLVSFGVAPAAILLTLLKLSMFGKNLPVYEITAEWDQWLILSTICLMPVAGAWRLARFNAFQADDPFFRGLPIPSNGLFWASLGIIQSLPHWQIFFKLIYSTQNLMTMGLFTSGMMIITIPMFSLKFKNLSIKDNWYRYLFLILTLILLITLKTVGFPLVILSYIALNIILYLARFKY